MAVSTKSIRTLDMNSGSPSGPHKRNVHYIKVGKGNRKGTAETIGGQLYDHLGHKTGDFHIVLKTRVNGKDKTINVTADDVVFRTETSKRWQVITKAGFKKRFPEARI